MGITGKHRSTLLKTPFCSHDGGVTQGTRFEPPSFPRQDGESFARVLEDSIPYLQRLQCPRIELCKKDCRNVKGDEK